MIKDKISLNVRDIMLMSMMLVLLEVSKYALSFIAGVEVVSLLIIIYTLYLGKKMVYVLPAFYLIEGMLYGFGIWWFMYLYIWVILAFITYVFKENKSIYFWSIISGVFGLAFGLLCCPIYFIIGGSEMAISWWITGIQTDIIHGLSNFIICMVLFEPLNRVISMLDKK